MSRKVLKVRSHWMRRVALRCGVLRYAAKKRSVPHDTATQRNASGVKGPLESVRVSVRALKASRTATTANTVRLTQPFVCRRPR